MHQGCYEEVAAGIGREQAVGMEDCRAICTAEVKESGENAWGLFGANGNVWETASREPGDSHFGGWFGGAWDDWQPNRLRADARYGFRGDAHGMVNGFRLVLAPVAEAAHE